MHFLKQFKTLVNRKHYERKRSESSLDQSYKKSLVVNLLLRCFSTCSDYTLFYLEVKNLREILKKRTAIHQEL